MSLFKATYVIGKECKRTGVKFLPRLPENRPPKEEDSDVQSGASDSEDSLADLLPGICLN